MIRLQLIGLGGTIAAIRRTEGGLVPRLLAEEIVSSVPELRSILDIEAVDFRSRPSHALTLDDLCELSDVVRRAPAAGFDGIVITQGTDTLEETAYLLALSVEREIPVVLTGAMRPSQSLGADGPANLLSAARVASDRRVAALGPVVVMQDEVHLARCVSKVRTSGPRAFASPGLGPVGAITEGRLELSALPYGADFVGIPPRLSHSVQIAWMSVGVDGSAVEALVDNADGIVVAGTGGGHVPPPAVGPLQRAVERGLPVVLASRVGAGDILRSTYSGPGSETQLLDLGLHPAGSLTPLKARLRLLVTLATGRRAAETFPP